MGWHLLETLLQQVGEHSTLVGKLWVTATFVFRLIIVASVGDAVYSDEQSDFTCNTMQPGCENVCFNEFSPISHLRFWAAQIIVVATPSIVFIVYATHRLLQVPQEEPPPFDDAMDYLSPPNPDKPDLIIGPEPLSPNASQPPSPSKKKKGGKSVTSKRTTRKPSREPVIGMVRGFANPPEITTTMVEDIKSDEEENKDEENTAEMTAINRQLEILNKLSPSPSKKEKRIKRSIQVAYVTSLLCRTGGEAVFLWLQPKLFGFDVPEVYACRRFPCPNTVDCFVSRPHEKTLFLWFMFAISVICLSLNVIGIMSGNAFDLTSYPSVSITMLEIKYLGIKRIKKLCCHPSVARKDDREEGNEDENNTKKDDNESMGSKDNYFAINEKVEPSAPTMDPKGLFNVVDYPVVIDEEKRESSDKDSIGFDMIGNTPGYPMPGYPHVHRYGMLLNSAPPKRISDGEVSYI